MKFAIFLVFSAFFLVGIVAEDDDEEGFLEGTCTEASDCYINGGDELALACYYNVKKCKCWSTVSSIYHLTWDKSSKQCLSSKYGHCGANGLVKVGCSDGFKCIDNRCRDPNDKTNAVKDVYKFPVKSCNACGFSNELQLNCEGYDTPNPSCVCEIQYMADKRSNFWEVRNYDGNRNCSVSQFGPCGTRAGIKIECHGEGMACVNGVCTNPAHPFSSVNEPCQEKKNCQKGLLCSYSYNCIKPKTSQRNTPCYKTEECQEGLVCKHSPLDGPWSSSKCYGKDETFMPTRRPT